MIFNTTYEQRVREAELEELRRLQWLRSMTRAAREASSRTIRKLRLALVSRARSLDYAILASKLIAKLLESC